MKKNRLKKSARNCFVYVWFCYIFSVGVIWLYSLRRKKEKTTRWNHGQLNKMRLDIMNNENSTLLSAGLSRALSMRTLVRRMLDSSPSYLHFTVASLQTFHFIDSATWGGLALAWLNQIRPQKL